jgi:hypothetical protein
LVVGCTGAPKIGLADSGAKALTPAEKTPLPELSESQAQRAPNSRLWGNRWCFGAGAPVESPPALGPDGEVYVATGEGYVHALTPEGGFHWSYTVKGAALGGPIVQPDGTIVVATRLNLIYALRPNGRRLWVYRVPEPITTALSVSTKGTLVFGAGQRQVYAVSRRGGLLWRVALSAAVTTPALIHENGSVFIGTEAGTATWVAPARRSMWPSPPVDRLVPQVGLNAEQQLWLASGQVFSSNGPMKLAEPVQFLRPLPDGRALAVSGQALLELSADGLLQQRTALPIEVSAEPMLAPNGDRFVPGADGRVLRVSAAGDVHVHSRLGSSEVSPLLLDATRERFVASSGEGYVCAASLSRASSQR